MSLSAMGNALTTFIHQPDFITILTIDKTIPGSEIRLSSTVYGNTMNALGCIPVVSTITGLTRALLGLVYTINHLARSAFNQHRQYHLQEAKLGAKNIKTGLIESLPIIGNITMYIIYLKREKIFDQMIKKQIAKGTFDNCATVFYDGQEIAKRSLSEYENAIQKLGRKPTDWDMIKIIENKA